MIKYKRIEFEDLNVIAPYMRWEDLQGCEWSAVNLLTWNSYGLEYAVLDGYLVLRFVYEGQFTHTMPVPPVPADEPHPRLSRSGEGCLARIVRLLRDEAFALHQPFSITNLNQWEINFLEASFPGEFDFSEPLTGRYDYICLRQNIIDLPGHALRPKRQHLSQFPKFYPNHEYRVLEPSMFAECLELLRRWNDNAEALGHVQAADAKVMERESIGHVFDNWQRFGATGGALYVDGRMVAFTYGVPINVNTFDLCVEKGDIAYKGVYTVVRHEFMKQIPEQYTYINLEEDMGLPGLRRAKSSYHPAYQIKKDRAVSLPEQSALAVLDRRDGVRRLMQTVFGDSDKALDVFFNRVYDPRGSYCYSDERRQVVASAQALDYTLLYHGDTMDAVYVYAVGTMPEMRHRQLMARLFKHMHRQLSCHGKAVATLLIEQPGLQAMYEKWGYAPVGTCPQQDEQVVERGFAPYDQWQRSQPCVLLQDERRWQMLQAYSLIDKSYYLVRPHYKGLVRIINAMQVLQHYAAAHPGLSLMVQVVGDQDICENNGCYAIAGGTVCRIERQTAADRVLSIRQLAELVYQDDPVLMPLVLL